MVSLALRNLASERGRLAASVGGVAFSVLLVLFLVGIYNGFLFAARVYVENAGADVWVMQDGTDDMFHSPSLLASSTGSRIRGVAGVDDVSPLVARVFQGHLRQEDGEWVGEEVEMLIVGFDVATGVGGPGTGGQGSLSPGRDEIVITRVLAEDQDVAIGDVLHVLDREVTVVGITDLPSVSLFTYAFVDLDMAREQFAMGDLVNFFLVRVRAGADPAAVAAAIDRRIDAVDAYPAATFGDLNGESIREVFEPILLAIAAIGLFIALVVVSVTSWSAVNERIAEYGVLKAMGADQGFLYRTVIAQSAVASLAGFAAGVPLYLGVSAAMVSLLPRIHVVTAWGLVAVLLGAVLAMALGAAWLPVRRIAGIHPADVFRGAG